MAEMSTLRDLFESELRDIYDAEKQILKALPKIIKTVSDEGLREVLSSHLEETQGHIERLDEAFESIGAKAKGKHCAGIEGILEEGKELMDEDAADEVLDAGLIASCQRVEHYEITVYGSLMAWAKLLGYSHAVKLLKANEQEEKAADMKLSRIAESVVNARAVELDQEGEERAQPIKARRSSGR